MEPSFIVKILNDKNNIAKSNGITLDTHDRDIKQQLKLYKNAYPNTFKKYMSMVSCDLYEFITQSIEIHDIGKDDVWRSFLKNIQIIPYRHEVVSILKCMGRDYHIDDIVKISVLSHHGKLNTKFISDKNENFILKCHNHLVKIKNLATTSKKQNKSILLSERVAHINNEIIDINIRDIRPADDFLKLARYKYKYTVVRGLLSLLDKRASAIEDNKYVPPMIKFDYTFPHTHMNNIQSKLNSNWNHNFTILKAKTGSGKTDASFIWAKNQIDNGYADRLIIAMPTRFTANALSVVSSEYIKGTGLYHSSSFQKKYTENKENAYIDHFYTKTLTSPVTVTTIDYLLSIIQNFNENSHIAQTNLFNSCIVIDEVDFHDNYTQANMEVFLRFCKDLNIPTLIMSATIPESHFDFYKNIGFNINKIVDDTDIDIIKYNINNITEYNDVTDITDILMKSFNQPTIIYSNTVDGAKNIYNKLLEIKHIDYDVNDIVLYHSQFLESDKMKKEANIISMLGKEAWKTNTAKGIVILTQIGEMSINISSNYMITDMCPVDKLSQRFGRGSRFDKNNACDIDIIIKHNDKGGIFPYPYVTIIDKKHAPSIPLQKTVESIVVKKYSYRDLNNIVNDVYSDGIILERPSIENKKAYIDNIKTNWLLTAYKDVDDSLGFTENWKSRNIEDSCNIFITPLSDYIKDHPSYFIGDKFKNDMFFNMYRDECSISFSAWYKIDKAIKNGILYKKDVYVDDRTINITSISDENSYTYCKGLDISDIKTNII